MGVDYYSRIGALFSREAAVRTDSTFDGEFIRPSATLYQVFPSGVEAYPFRIGLNTLSTIHGADRHHYARYTHADVLAFLRDVEPLARAGCVITGYSMPDCGPEYEKTCDMSYSDSGPDPGSDAE